MGFTNILFDLDGTLTDPQQGIFNCIRYALEQMGREVNGTRGWERYIGPPLLASFAELLQTSDMAEAHRALGFYRERFAQKGLFENRVYADIEEVLANVSRAGGNLYVATSKPRVFARRIIDFFQLSQYFRAVHGSELDGTRVDKGELLSYVLQTENLDPEHTLMVGDREFDIHGARAAGVAVAGVLWGYGSREELESAGADWLCSKPDELTAICLANG